MRLKNEYFRSRCEEIVRKNPRYKDAPLWAVYYWTAYMVSHRYEEDGVNIATFKVTPTDAARFPEIAGSLTVTVYEDDEGYVHGFTPDLN